ncbi:uncharacterized protein METZ01_LOCUS111241 [marine metagenome]|uniref:Uncharacterized protein n=1 Tax=marine metagenome TaxID=408172 RepID=A0A381X2J9_9ZZZZ
MNIITCEVCKMKIVEYYDNQYKGKRGKCLSCGIDFPLE